MTNAFSNFSIIVDERNRNPIYDTVFYVTPFPQPPIQRSGVEKENASHNNSNINIERLIRIRVNMAATLIKYSLTNASTRAQDNHQTGAPKKYDFLRNSRRYLPLATK